MCCGIEKVDKDLEEFINDLSSQKINNIFIFNVKFYNIDLFRIFHN